MFVACVCGWSTNRRATYACTHLVCVPPPSCSTDVCTSVFVLVCACVWVHGDGNVVGILLLLLKVPLMFNQTFDPGFFIALHNKDLGIARKVGWIILKRLLCCGLLLCVCVSLCLHRQTTQHALLHTRAPVQPTMTLFVVLFIHFLVLLSVCANRSIPEIGTLQSTFRHSCGCNGARSSTRTFVWVVSPPHPDVSVRVCMCMCMRCLLYTSPSPRDRG